MMGIATTRRIRDLGTHLVLAPERYDPRRTIQVATHTLLRDQFDIVTRNATRESLGDRPVLVLDTSNAYDGFVTFKHAAAWTRVTKPFFAPHCRRPIWRPAASAEAPTSGRP